MIRILLFACLCFSNSCLAQLLPLYMEHPNKKNFNITLQIDKTDNQYLIVATLELAKGSYIISPYSEDTTYLHFDLYIEETDKLILTNPIQEIPNSIEEFDSILNKPVRFVRKNTTYKQDLKMLQQTDFEVAGLIEFLVEPSCIPYDIVFTITNQSGIIKIQNIKTIISEEYKLR